MPNTTVATTSPSTTLQRSTSQPLEQGHARTLYRPRSRRKEGFRGVALPVQTNGKAASINPRRDLSCKALWYWISIYTPLQKLRESIMAGKAHLNYFDLCPIKQKISSEVSGVSEHPSDVCAWQREPSTAPCPAVAAACCGGRARAAFNKVPARWKWLSRTMNHGFP